MEIFEVSSKSGSRLQDHSVVCSVCVVLRKLVVTNGQCVRFTASFVVANPGRPRPGAPILPDQLNVVSEDLIDGGGNVL